MGFDSRLAYTRKIKNIKVTNTKVFGFAFYKKRTGVGGAHRRKAKQKLKNEKQSEAIKKEDRHSEYVKNARHSQTGIHCAELFTQREIQNENCSLKQKLALNILGARATGGRPYGNSYNFTATN